LLRFEATATLPPGSGSVEFLSALPQTFFSPSLTLAGAPNFSRFYPASRFILQDSDLIPPVFSGQFLFLRYSTSVPSDRGRRGILFHSSPFKSRDNQTLLVLFICPRASDFSSFLPLNPCTLLDLFFVVFRYNRGFSSDPLLLFRRPPNSSSSPTPSVFELFWRISQTTPRFSQFPSSLSSFVWATSVAVSPENRTHSPLFSPSR